MPSRQPHLARHTLPRLGLLAGAALLEKGDVLVVAGKGHEQGQLVAGVTHPFDDVAETAAALGLVQLQRLPQSCSGAKPWRSATTLNWRACPWCCLPAHRRAMCTPGTCTWCVWRRAHAWGAMR